MDKQEENKEVSPRQPDSSSPALPPRVKIHAVKPDKFDFIFAPLNRWWIHYVNGIVTAYWIILGTKLAYSAWLIAIPIVILVILSLVIQTSGHVVDIFEFILKAEVPKDDSGSTPPVEKKNTEE
jgi:hypothetical protein